MAAEAGNKIHEHNKQLSYYFKYVNYKRSFTAENKHVNKTNLMETKQLSYIKLIRVFSTTLLNKLKFN